MNRISRDNLNLSIALLIAERSTCRRAKVGCLITIENRVVSTGFNGSSAGAGHCEDLGCDIKQKCSHAIHAEQNAICFAAKEGISIKDATLYCTTEPCYECSKLIYQAGIREVIFLRLYGDGKGCNFLQRMGIKLKWLDNHDEIQNHLNSVRVQ